MPLVQATLQTALAEMFKKMSSTKDLKKADVGLAWAKAYSEYAASALCSGMAYVGIPTNISTKISGDVDKFIDEFSAGLKEYWTTPGIWTPVGIFTGSTISADGASALLKTAMTTPTNSVDEAAQKIANALHTYTTMNVTVSVINSSSGVTVTLMPL
ncbi:MAG: hypothetical protein WC895_04285 [Candidatus Shapirobacteria bacterium]|jgi:hypothetical protein